MSDEFYDIYRSLNSDTPEPEAQLNEPQLNEAQLNEAQLNEAQLNEAQNPVVEAEPEMNEGPSSSEQHSETATLRNDTYPQPEPVTSQEPSRPVSQPDATPSYEYTNPYSSAQVPIYTAPTYPSYEAPKADPSYQPTPSVLPSDNSYMTDDGFYHRSFTEHHNPYRYNTPTPEKRSEQKKKSGGMSKGAVALLLIVCLLVSAAAGFGGSMLAGKINEDSLDTVSDTMIIHKVGTDTVTDTGETLVDKSTSEITEEVGNAVVEITTEVVQTSSFYGQYIAEGAGSGVIISSDGYIVTNNHVIEGASSITVTLRTGESYDAELIGTDEVVDIALIKIDAENLTEAIFGDSDTLTVGDKAVIIGNPLGTLGGSVTEGIISALDRAIVIDGKTMHLMQTDAAINPGNSGGGMFSGQGELVGIVVAKSSSEEIDNIGFVIPINNVLNILSDLKEYGYVRGRVDTGMDFLDLTNEMYAWYYYGAYSTGCFVSSVDSGSNAAIAGFREGDRIVSVNGETVSTSDDIEEIISDMSVGDTVEFVVERSGRTGTIELELEEYVPDSIQSNGF